MKHWPTPRLTAAQLILGKTAAQQHMCAQRQGTGSGQLRAPLRQVDGGVTEKGGCDRVVENERRAVDDLMGGSRPRDAGGRPAGSPRLAHRFSLPPPVGRCPTPEWESRQRAPTDAAALTNAGRSSTLRQ
jgi:hypothetical protein